MSEKLDAAAGELARLYALESRAKLLEEALRAAKEWILENTSSEDQRDTMYERGWWDADTRLMKQIDEALASERKGV